MNSASLGARMPLVRPRDRAQSLVTGKHSRYQSLARVADKLYSRDVARGLLWVLDNCTRNSKKDVAGFNAAYGNGDLIVGGTKQSW